MHQISQFAEPLHKNFFYRSVNVVKFHCSQPVRHNRFTDRESRPGKSQPNRGISTTKKTGTVRKTVTSKYTAPKSPSKSPSPKPRSPKRRTFPHRTGRTQKIADQLAPPRQLDSERHLNDHLEHPKTFREYLDKYYGTVERRDMRARSLSEDDLSQHSDSAVDYTPEVEKR